MSKGWKMVKLSQIAKIMAGQSAPKNESDFSNEGIPFIRAGHLEQLISGLPEESLPKITTEVALKYKLKKYSPCSILFAKSGMSATLNRIYKLKKEAYIVSHLAIIEPNQIVVDTDFLTYQLQNIRPSILIKDSSYPSISLSDINILKIQLPTIFVQRKIAATLDKASELITLRKKQLEELDALAESVFNDMFGDPVKNEKGWKKKQWKDLFKTRLGKMLDKKKQIETDDLCPYLGNSNVLWGDFKLDALQMMTFSTKEQETLELNPNDLLICEGADSSYQCDIMSKMRKIF